MTPAGIVEDEAVETAVEPFTERFALQGRSLREHTARGAIINTLFQAGVGVLGLVQRVAVAALLTITEYGLWGLIVTALITLAWLKQIGIADKFVQQDEADQEAAFQKAFTLELAYSAIFFAIACVVFPVLGAIYGHMEIVVPGIVLALSLVISAAETPIWIAYRQMRFVRQRVLESIDPVVSATVTIVLAIAGLGYWSLVLGPVAGSICGGIAAVTTSPYPLRLRWDSGTLREYFSFSWPLLASSASGLVIVQASVLIGNFTVGLAGLGALGLATTFSMFADRLDSLIRRTIYPAVCAVKDRTALLFEAFEKSNRLALMWAFPFGVGLALFAPDLISFVLGERWREAEVLLQVFGLTIAVRQVAFNWVIFFSAIGDNRPLAVSSFVQLGVFAVVTAPLMIAFGLDGYAAGMAVAVCVDLGVRGYFLSRLFQGFAIGRHLVRSVAPSVPPALAILLLRGLTDVNRTLGVAVAELCLYVALTVGSTIVLERSLLTELFGYLRRGVRGGSDSRSHVAEQPHPALERLALGVGDRRRGAHGRGGRGGRGCRVLQRRPQRRHRLAVGLGRRSRRELERVRVEVEELLALAAALELAAPVGGRDQRPANAFARGSRVDAPVGKRRFPPRILGGSGRLELRHRDPVRWEAVGPRVCVGVERGGDHPRERGERDDAGVGAGRRPARRSPAGRAGAAGRARTRAPSARRRRSSRRDRR